MKSIGEVTRAARSIPESLAAKVDAVVKNLEKRKSARPRTLNTLRTTVRALFAGQIADDVEGLIRQLAERGLIRVEGGKVRYTG